MIAEFQNRQLELNFSASLLELSNDVDMPQGELIYAVGDRVSLIDVSPSRIYQITKITGNNAICLAVEADQTPSRRLIPLWKIRPVCSIAEKTSSSSPRTVMTDEPKATPHCPLEHLSGCAHHRISIGLDRAHCPDYCREFPSWTKEYRLLWDTQQTPCPREVCKAGEHHRKQPGGWIEKYRVQRRWEYHRYCWQEGRKGKVHQTHIPNDSGKLATVKAAIASGKSSQQIERLIKSWGSDRSKV